MARFAEAVRSPPLRPDPDTASDALGALLASRRQVIERPTTEKNRLSPTPKPMR